MSKGLITFAAILIAIGVGAYAASGAASVTALIPAFFGLAIGVCALLAAAKPGATRAATIAALLLALLGLGGSLSRLIPAATSDEGLTMELKYLAQIAMSVVCIALIAWGAAVLLKRPTPPA